MNLTHLNRFLIITYLVVILTIGTTKTTYAAPQDTIHNAILMAFNKTPPRLFNTPPQKFEPLLKSQQQELVLKKFFKKYNSPLIGTEKKFIEVANQYGIDYKLLPSIACMESTCGKQIPYNSYNPFGWGVTGGKWISFTSWEHAIETVGRGLNKGYFSKGLDTIEEIAPVYTGHDGQHWKKGVTWFYNQIELIEKDLDLNSQNTEIKNII